MRRHSIRTQMEGNRSTENIQNRINLSTVSYIKRMLDESRLTKEEQLYTIEKLMEYMGKDNTGGPLC